MRCDESSALADFGILSHVDAYLLLHFFALGMLHYMLVCALQHLGGISTYVSYVQSVDEAT